MATLVSDLRLAVRQLIRKPAFALTAILTLAAGMGVNTVAFAVVNSLLFKGPATKSRPDVGRVLTTPGSDEGANASVPEFERFAAAATGALDLAAEGRSTIAWQHDGITETAWVLYVTRNYFSMVDVRPLAGHLQVARAGTQPPAVVIGERFWRDKLASPPLAGLTLRLNHVDVAVSGVLPESYTGPAGIYSPDVWLPLEDLALFGVSARPPEDRTDRWLFMLGRLAPDANAAVVQARLDAAAADMAREWPDTHRERGARFRMLREGNSELRGIALAGAIGMGLIGLVLLLACFNVANLLLARAVDRERDMGIRSALGASPARLVRLVITEGFVIAIASGILALVLAQWTQSLLGTFAIPIETPQHLDLAPDFRVIAFIGGLVLIAGVLPGVWPAIAAARVDVIRVLGSQGANTVAGRPSRLGRWLVGAQIAGSTAFLVIAALFLQSFIRVHRFDAGFAADELVVAEFAPASHGYDAARSERYVDALLTRLRELPSIRDAAVANRAPFFIGFDNATAVWPAKGPCPPRGCPRVVTISVGAGFFRTAGIAMVAGKDFDAGARPGDVIVNQKFASQQWPDGRGLGETLRLGADGRAVTVIGITANHRTRVLDRDIPALYVPVQPQTYGGAVSVVARTVGDPSALVRVMVDEARAVDGNVAMTSVRTMRQRMAVVLWPLRTLTWLFSICSGLAMLLGTVGLASVVAHAVNRRRREFGVRVSIGATRKDLIGDVLRGGAVLLAPGVAAGLLLAAGGARLTQSLLVGVDVWSAVTYVAVAVLQSAIVAAACLAPAIRASRVDAMVALRSE